MDFLLPIFLALGAIALILVYPFFAVMRCTCVSGTRKLAWLILVLLFSWFAYFPFLLIEECWLTE